MRIVTRHWGEQEIDEQRIVTFAEGVPGFPECRRFAVLSREHDTFLWLQAVDCPEVALPVAEAFGLFPTYDVELDAEDVALLNIKDLQNVAVLVVITVRGDPIQATANLLAPIVINTATRLARQKVLARPDYSIRHPLFPQAAAPAGS